MNMRIDADAARELRWFGNTLIAVNLSSSAGADGIAVIEHWMPSGDAPPLHVHHREDEVFHIIEGEIRFRVGDREHVARELNRRPTIFRVTADFRAAIDAESFHGR